MPYEHGQEPHSVRKNPANGDWETCRLVDGGESIPLTPEEVVDFDEMAARSASDSGTEEDRAVREHLRTLAEQAIASRESAGDPLSVPRVPLPERLLFRAKPFPDFDQAVVDGFGSRQDALDLRILGVLCEFDRATEGVTLIEIGRRVPDASEDVLKAELRLLCDCRIAWQCDWDRWVVGPNGSMIVRRLASRPVPPDADGIRLTTGLRLLDSLNFRDDSAADLDKGSLSSSRRKEGNKKIELAALGSVGHYDGRELLYNCKKLAGVLLPLVGEGVEWDMGTLTAAFERRKEDGWKTKDAAAKNRKFFRCERGTTFAE